MRHIATTAPNQYLGYCAIFLPRRCILPLGAFGGRQNIGGIDEAPSEDQVAGEIQSDAITGASLAQTAHCNDNPELVCRDW